MTGSPDGDDVISRLRDNPGDADASAVELGIDALDGGAMKKQREAATGVAAVAEVNPDHVVPFVDRLQQTASEDAVVESMVTSALADVAAAHPDQVRTAVPYLIGRVEGGDPMVRRNALRALARVASHAPTSVTPARQATLDALCDAAEHDDETRAHAAVVLRQLSEVVPEQLVEDTDRLLGVLRATSATEQPHLSNGPDADEELERERQDVLVHHASTGTALASTLVILATEVPARLTTSSDTIAAALSNADAGVGAHIAESLAILGAEDPTALCGQAETLAAVLDDERTRPHAATALAYLAEDNPEAVADAVVPHIDSLLAAVPRADSEERRAMVGLLAYVAEERPSAVRPGRDTVVDLLGDDDAGVRGQALWTLRFIGVDSLEPLRTIESEDPVSELRILAGDVRDSLADG
ncbi:HEAT repeat domain-containing protein [Halomarina rubra]|uniref:HEAT repeat domain-containing protein n=1 Tax=Halomarina rubra TaxID=2071873 RepID=A0ABD6AQY6_9EURY|nr:HEAT repeat domain-containing protein [Halomarina rubra]